MTPAEQRVIVLARAYAVARVTEERTDSDRAYVAREEAEKELFGACLDLAGISHDDGTPCVETLKDDEHPPDGDYCIACAEQELRLPQSIAHTCGRTVQP